MNMKKALEVAKDYPDTKGYELGFRKDRWGRLILSDGVVQVDVTDFDESDLRSEIKDWIDSADDFAICDEKRMEVKN